jgi:tRNA(fMet)-specific endonuclease VapC
MIMLDTNICVVIIKKRPQSVLERFESLSDECVSISVITFAELQFGVEKSLAQKRNQNVLDAFLANLLVLPWERDAGSEYAKLRCSLERQGTPMSNMDLLIAAHALSQEAVLVTNNIKEFERVPGLDVESWG